MLNSLPVVSVIMPVFNGERFLIEAIESILVQTFVNFEFIIINDGSTDNTENIICSYSDSRIQYVKNECNMGLIATLNRGVSIARGKYIARMDADDVSLPDRLEKQVKIMQYYRGITIVNCSALQMDEKGKILHQNKFCVGFEAIRYINILNCLISHPSIMIRTNSLQKYKYDDALENLYIEDLDLWTRMLIDAHIIYTIETPLLLYRINSNGISKKHSELQLYNHLVLAEKTIRKLLPEFTGYNENILKLIIDTKCCSYSEYKSVVSFCNNYYYCIISTRTVSKQCSRDLILWKRYTIVKTALTSMSYLGYIDKVRVALMMSFNVNVTFYFSYLKKYLLH